MDNVVDRTPYPLEQQAFHAKAKRRMGLGVTGAANAIEYLGHPYASEGYIEIQDRILNMLKNEAYKASALLAKEKGAFPFFDREKYLQGNFIKTLEFDTLDLISKYGIRNSHLTSIAPTGTISLCADNVSGGIEPTFAHSYDRTIQTFDGPIVEEVKDYAYNKWGFKGKKTSECSILDHVRVLANAQKHMDSACSKTCNVGDDVTFEEFKNVYIDAFRRGCKGITTFRAAGKRYGILNEKPKEEERKPEANQIDKEIETSGAQACYFDPLTGKKQCE